jgi:hypothetical protein
VPGNLRLDFPFESQLGGCNVQCSLKGLIDGGRDHWLGGYLCWSGLKEAAPANASFAFELVAMKDGGGSELLSGLGHCIDDYWQRGSCWGTERLCKWSQLLDSCSLQLTVITLPSSEAPATFDTALRIHNNLKDTTFASIGALLDGPFTDVAVTAGGRTFRAHRVVLAGASPVFLGMLDGDMRESREAAVELVGADAGAVELLLRHVYGNPIEVPVSLALQLYALADQYQVAGGLKQQLRLMALQLAPGARCELVAAAQTLCPWVYVHGLQFQAGTKLDQLSPLPAFAGWPVDAVVEVMAEAEALPAFNAAVAWVEAGPMPVGRAAAGPLAAAAGRSALGHGLDHRPLGHAAAPERRQGAGAAGAAAGCLPRAVRTARPLSS